MRHPGIGSLGNAALLIARDAQRGSLGLTAAQAHEMIINRRRGWCVGWVGWTWLKIVAKTDEEVAADKLANPTWNADGEGWHIDIEVDLGRPSVWALKRKGGERSAYRFNWADYATEFEHRKPDAFLHDDLVDAGYEMSYSSYGDSYVERILRLGLVPGQELLVRGKGWSSFTQTPNGDDYDDGYNTEIIYASPADIDDNILADILAKDSVCHVRVG